MIARAVAQAETGSAQARSVHVAPVRSPVMQRCGGVRCPPGMCDHAEGETPVARLASSVARPVRVPSQVHEVLAHGGRPLDGVTRAAMEQRLGHDFSRVRVHADAAAADSADRVAARAYTVGSHVVFAAGEYRPGSAVGDRVLAHELVHVMQQAAGGVSGEPAAVSHPGDAAEREAEALANRLTSDGFRASHAANEAAPVMHPPAYLQRLGDPSRVPPSMRCPVATTTAAGASLDVEFDQGSSVMRPSAVAAIDAFARSWRASGATDSLRVDGYASTEGTDELNWQLSCDRAEAVAAELMAPSSDPTAGVMPDMIELAAHGETDEFSSSRPPNRRAVIAITTAPPAPTPAPGPPACATPTNPDLSGPAHNPTTDSQNSMIAQHPIDALTVRGLATDSFAAARRSGLPGPHLGPQDAFRHCFWNCRMTQELSAARAEEFATAHENSGPSAIPFDNQMDLHNNAVGRSLGTPGADCEAVSAAAVRTGQLRTIRGPGTRPPSPVTTTCLGPSDQPWP